MEATTKGETAGWARLGEVASTRGDDEDVLMASVGKKPRDKGWGAAPESPPTNSQDSASRDRVGGKSATCRFQSGASTREKAIFQGREKKHALLWG